jgi:hypothetical protein
LNVRVASLEPTRRIVEEQLELARHVEIARLRSEHQTLSAELHPDDRDSDLFDLQQQVTHLLPKVFRGGFLISLWSVLERCTQDIATRAAERAGRHLPPKLFRHSRFIAAAESAIHTAVQLAAFPEQVERKRLEQLGLLRNVLVHHDGRITELPSALAGLNNEQLAAHGLHVVRDYDFAYVVPTEEYMRENTALVVNYIHSLASRVFDALDYE